MHSGNARQEKSSTATADLFIQEWLLIRSVSQSLLEKEQFSQQGGPGVDYNVVPENGPIPSFEGGFRSCCEVMCKVEGTENQINPFRVLGGRENLLRDSLCFTLRQGTCLHGVLF